jgi:hypothetical protein
MVDDAGPPHLTGQPFQTIARDIRPEARRDRPMRTVAMRLWSRAVATAGNRWQTGRPRKRLKKLKTVAVGCDPLPRGL